MESYPDGRQLVQALIDWQQSKRGGYTVGLDVRRYLNYVVEARLGIGASSLLSFRQKLEADSSLSDGTRRSYYSNASAFTQILMSRGVVGEEELPPGLRGVRKKPKPTFAEKVRNWEGIVDTPEFVRWRESAAAVPGLDSSSREVLGVSEGWMNRLEQCAATAVLQQLSDWRFADEVLAGKISDQAGWEEERSIGAALACLHERFGYLLPASPNWPAGIADYCKARGWPPNRLKAAFFPTVKALDAFLVLALANARLMPNVDSVLYYAFAGCVTDAEDSNLVRVRFGKFRGGAATNTIEKRSALSLGLRNLESVVMRALGDASDLPGLLKDGGIPLFLHYSGSNGRSGIRRMDPSMAAYMVRRFIAKAACAHPVLAPLLQRVTGENFRTTHLLCRRLRGESIFAVQSDAGHKNPSTTANYLERVEVEASANRRHWDYQRYLVDEAKSHAARRLGNGFHCKPQEKEQTDCLRTDACSIGASGCSARRVVLESPKIVAEWLAWSDHIRSHAVYLKKHRPERWEGVWAARLLDYEVLLESVSTSVRNQALQYVSAVTLLPLE